MYIAIVCFLVCGVYLYFLCYCVFHVLYLLFFCVWVCFVVFRSLVCVSVVVVFVLSLVLVLCFGVVLFSVFLFFFRVCMFLGCHVLLSYSSYISLGFVCCSYDFCLPCVVCCSSFLL